MASAKNVPVLKHAGSDDFPLWCNQVLAYLEHKAPRSAELLRSNAADREAEIVRGANGDVNVELAARAAQQRENELAKSHVLQFLDNDLAKMMEPRSTGTDLWAALKEAYDRWALSMATSWLQQYEALRPAEGQTVASFCANADLLALRLHKADMGKSARELITKVLSGLKAARPQWTDWVKLAKLKAIAEANRLQSANELVPGRVLEQCGLTYELQPTPR